MSPRSRKKNSTRALSLIMATSVALFASCSGMHVAHDAEADIVTAVKNAHGLEQYLWSHQEQFQEREAVYRHYRTGFSDELAANLTNYTWPEGSAAMRPGDATLLPPETVQILEMGETYARVYFPTPEAMRELWGQDEFTVVDLEKEGGRWVVVSSSTVAAVPTANL